MNTKPNDGATAERWQIRGEYITDTEGSERFRVMGSAPYNAAWMTRAVQAVNEHAALLAMEAQFNSILIQLEAFGMCVPPNASKAQANLAKLRGGAK